MRNLIGQQIGPYKIEELIGGGGMADVYKAHQANLDRYVAIKVLKMSLADDPEFVARFSREAMASGGLRHPNILKIYDAGTLDDRHYIVMDYASGGTLANRAEKNPYTIDEAAVIGIQLAEALDYAHRRPRPVIHRDLKPSNILLEDDRPLIADFGIAYIASTEARLTQTGASLGTPEYMSPEQSEGSPVDGRTDIYSLGVVLYQLVTGRVPFQGKTPIATMHQVVYTPPPQPRQFKSDVPDWMESIILRALAKRPEDRFATAGEMAEALRKQTVVPVAAPSAAESANVAQAGLTQAVRHERRPAPVPVERPQAARGGIGRTPLVALLGIVVLAVLGGAAYLALPTIQGRADDNRQMTPNAALAAVSPTALVPQPAVVAETATPAREAKVGSGLAPTEAAASAAGALAPADNGSPANAAPTATSLPPTIKPLPPTNTPPPPTNTPLPPTNTPPPPTNTPPPPTNTPLPPTNTPPPPTNTPLPQTSTPLPATRTPIPQTLTAARPAPAAPGDVLDFESFGTWQIGNERYGTLTQSSEQAHSGTFSAKLAYDFPVVDNEYVVFLKRPGLALPAEPAALTLWVYGDGSGHYLNTWVKDYAGQVRQFTFGRVSHQGWRQMTASLDPAAPWPQGHISGPESNNLVYPLSLEAFVFDAVPHRAGPFSGAIYLDGLGMSGGEAQVPAQQAPADPYAGSAPAAQATARP